MTMALPANRQAYLGIAVMLVLLLTAAADTPLRPGSWRVQARALSGTIGGKPATPEQLATFNGDATNCLDAEQARDPLTTLGARICPGQLVRREGGHASVTGTCAGGDGTEIELAYRPTHFAGTLTAHVNNSDGAGQIVIQLTGDYRGACKAPKPEKQPRERRRR